jgi:hypothetical protein
MSNNEEKEDINIQSEFTIICPHCKDTIIIEKLNCGIFRHGVFKTNLQQIPPHESENVCENLIQNNLIYGCGKPFKIYKKEDTFLVDICEYI